LRASEVCDLQWHQIELSEGRLHVRRVKNGMPSVHPLTGKELRALRRLQREQWALRVHERARGTVGFRRMLERLGEAAKMAFGVHPHMLRHACGFKLANQGVDRPRTSRLTASIRLSLRWVRPLDVSQFSPRKNRKIGLSRQLLFVYFRTWDHF